jgi:hypothetical protein
MNDQRQKVVPVALHGVLGQLWVRSITLVPKVLQLRKARNIVMMFHSGEPFMRQEHSGRTEGARFGSTPSLHVHPF